MREINLGMISESAWNMLCDDIDLAYGNAHEYIVDDSRNGLQRELDWLHALLKTRVIVAEWTNANRPFISSLTVHTDCVVIHGQYNDFVATFDDYYLYD